MTFSNSNLLLVTVAIAVVMTLDHVPAAEGLKCYICTGSLNTSISNGGKQYQQPSDEELKNIRRAEQAYKEKMDRAMPCKDFTATTQKEDRAQIECLSFWPNQICMTHKTQGRGCSVDFPEPPDQPDTVFAPINTCPPDAKGCKCNRNLCNGVVFGASSKADDMNDSSKRGVVSLIGISFFVGGNYFGSGGGFF
ncbi:uncharacterized protein LOC110849500 [Folsomia candida]|uniref:uncharacterized protein LOC110849500 n=1 Tax=Folsomia candida TaxID=158441 RepID=UPI0016051238|nr:uncharacterized protein LOC110849500 [Folsomia candida]